MHFFSIFGGCKVSNQIKMVEEEQKKFERINTIIHENSQEASYYVAQEIISLVSQRQKEERKWS